MVDRGDMVKHRATWLTVDRGDMVDMSHMGDWATKGSYCLQLKLGSLESKLTHWASM